MDYKQVRLKAPFGEAPDVYQVEIVWIPTKYAIKGQQLRVDGRPGLWLVDEVWHTAKPESVLRKWEVRQ